MIKIIAELGWSHLGNWDIIHSSINHAALSGADYIKFQTWNTEKLKPGPWDSDGRRELYKKAQLKQEDYSNILKLCKIYKIKFLTSCFCIEDLEFIRTLTNEIKIPGHECHNSGLIKRAIDIFDVVYLSIGGSTFDEYSKWFDFQNVVFMHCVSAYPCLAENVNLRKLKFLVQNTQLKVGYSGHYFGNYDAMAAIVLGATVIEKHFTIDRSLSGRDNKYALLPYQFKELRKFSDEFYLMTQDKGLDYQPCELDIRDNYRGRWSGTS